MTKKDQKIIYKNILTYLTLTFERNNNIKIIISLYYLIIIEIVN